MTKTGTTRFYLYHTLGCHLCEDAEAVIALVFSRHHCHYQKIDIANSDTLIALYGIRIPVLHNAETNKDIGWPFDAARIEEFLRQDKHEGHREGH